MVSCGDDAIVKVWDVKTCTVKSCLTEHTAPVMFAEVSPDGSLLATSDSKCFKMWDIADAKMLYSFNMQGDPYTGGLCYCPTRYWLCGGTSSGIFIVDLENKLGHTIWTSSPVTALCWMPDGDTLITGHEDNSLAVWQFPSWEEQPSAAAADVNTWTTDITNPAVQAPNWLSQ